MSAPMREAFHGAVERILNSWTVLKLAVAHGFGGADSQEKAEWMVHAIDQWFSENADIDPWELEEFLADVLNNEFDTVADDESLPQVSQMICGCYKLIQTGDEVGLKARLDSLPQPAVQNCVPTHVNQEVEVEEDMDSGKNEPVPPDTSQTNSHENSQEDTSDMETDMDGWTTVGKKGKRR